MNNERNYADINRSSWNQRTQEHDDADFYDVKGFLAGHSSLNPPELELLGDVSGKKILHLQCHFGMDTLSLARMDARVTGGKFVMVEFHPVLWMFDEEFNNIVYPYHRDEPYITVSETYTNAEEKGQYEEVTWNHGLSVVLQGLLHNGLRITDFREYDYSPVNLFGNMAAAEEGKYRIAGKENRVPILFSVVATK